MNISHLEKRLKDLNKHRSEIDSTEVWKILEPKLNENANRRKIFLMRFFGISTSFIFLVALSYFFLFQNQTQNYTDTKNSVIDFKNDDNSIVKYNGNINVNVNENVNENENENIVEINRNLNNKRELNIGKFEGNSKHKELNTNQPHHHENDTNTVQSLQQNQTKDNNQLKAENKSKNSKNIYVSNENRQTQFSSNDQEIKSDLLNKNQTLTQNIHSLTISKLNIPQLELITQTPKIEPCPTISNKKNIFSFSIRPYAEYSYPMTQFSSQGGDMSLETIRSRLESNYVAYSYGVELRAKTRSGLHIFTGINQSIIRDQFDYSNERDTLLLLEDIIKDISINENQDSIITIGDTIVNARLIETGRKFNTYKSLDIPIGFEISKRMSKAEIGLSATALINLTFQTKGSVTNENEEFSSIEGKYKNSIGVRFKLSAPIQYYLNKRINLGLSPSFIYSPKSISNPSYLVEHRVNLFSIRLFADYTF